MNYTFQFGQVFAHFNELLWEALLTLRLSALSMVLGLLIAILAALGLTYGNRLVRTLITAYVEVIRNTPFLVQIALVFFGLPSFGIRLDPNQAGLLAMVINISAYSTEIVRAGVESITRGQIEAAIALGLRNLTIFRLIILPRALQIVYPALTSQFVLVMLSSSVLSTISTEELTAVANNIDSTTFRTIEVYLVVAAMYFALSMIFSLLFHVLYKFYFRSIPAARG